MLSHLQGKSHLIIVHNYRNWASEAILLIFAICYTVPALFKPLYPNKITCCLLWASCCSILSNMKNCVDMCHTNSSVEWTSFAWMPDTSHNYSLFWVGSSITYQQLCVLNNEWLGDRGTYFSTTCPYLRDCFQPTTPFYSRCCHYTIMHSK